MPQRHRVQLYPVNQEHRSRGICRHEVTSTAGCSSAEGTFWFQLNYLAFWLRLLCLGSKCACRGCVFVPRILPNFVELASRRYCAQLIFPRLSPVSLLSQEEIDIDAIKSVFPYGELLPIEFQSGGMRASSGIALPEMGGKVSTLLICGGRVRTEMCDWVSVSQVHSAGDARYHAPWTEFER